MSDQKQDDGFGSPLGWGFVIAGSLALGFILISIVSPGVKFQGRAQIFGDVVGTVVSTFALVLLIFTVMQQQRAIRLQREDLALNREELRETRKELADAAKAQQQQVEVAQLTARLNAATARLNHYQGQIDELERWWIPVDRRGPDAKERKRYSERIEALEPERNLALNDVKRFEREMGVTTNANSTTEIDM